MRELEEDLPGIRTASDCLQVAEEADLIILAVKPIFVRDVIDEIRSALSGKAVLSIAAGWTVKMLEKELRGTDAAYMRVMPNTPALVGEGMTAYCANDLVSEKDLELVRSLLQSFGKAEQVHESLMDVVTSISGSSPAYVFLIIEAMADGAVADGMPRDKAYRFAAQALLGAAKMVLETGKHPGELKDMVCSPGGTTIEAIQILEKRGLRSALIEAERACTLKSRGL
jgi:pyrroline-5-carboxylate reductase